MKVHDIAPREQADHRIVVGVGDTISKIPAVEFDRRVDSAGGARHLELVFAAVRAGALAFALIPQGGRYRGLPDVALGKPLLLTLGDDMATSRGPGAFDAKTLRRALDGAGAVVVHAAAAELEHYQAAVDAAQRHGKAVIVECQPSTETAWLACVAKYAPGAGVLVITPQPWRYQMCGGTA